jgi:hypothetical protein
VTKTRASYGYRRTHRLVNREREASGETPYNRKRIRRVMRIAGLMLPGKKRHRFDRPHTGKVEMPISNQRWCSDGFNIPCWNGDVVRVAFALDCHDREALGHVARARDLSRRGHQASARRGPLVPVRRTHSHGSRRDPVALGQRRPLHFDGHGPLRPDSRFPPGDDPGL